MAEEVVAIRLSALGATEVEGAMNRARAAVNRVNTTTAASREGINKVGNAFVDLARTSIGASGPVGRLAEGLGLLTLGGPLVVGIAAGIAAIGFAYRQLTKDAREAREENKKLIDGFISAREARLDREDPRRVLDRAFRGTDAGRGFEAEATRLNRELEEALKGRQVTTASGAVIRVGVDQSEVTRLRAELRRVGQAADEAARQYRDAIADKAKPDSVSGATGRARTEVRALAAEIEKLPPLTADNPLRIEAQARAERERLARERARRDERGLSGGFERAFPDGGDLVGGAVDRTLSRSRGLDALIDPAAVIPDETIAGIEGRLDTMLAGLKGKLAAAAVDLNGILQQGVGDALFAGIASIVTGNGDVVLQALGSIFSQMGQSLLASGAAMIGLLPALSNPFTSGPAMLAAGAVLSALGVALGAAATGGSGGSGRVTGSQDAGSRSITIRVPSSNLAQPAGKAAAQTPVNVTYYGGKDPKFERWLSERVTAATARGVA